MRYLLTYCLIFTFFFTSAQNKIIDSLTNLLNNTSSTDDTTIISLNNDIALEFLNIGKYDKAEEVFNLVFSLSKKINYDIGIFKSKYGKSYILHLKSETNKAIIELKKLEKEINISNIPDTNKLKLLSPIYSSFGSMYSAISNYDKSLGYHIKSSEISKKLGAEHVHNYAITLGNISTIYHEIGDLDEAIKYQLEAIEIKKKRSSDFSIGLSYYNLSQIYDNKKEFQKAIDILNISEKYAKKANDNIGIALCNISMGNIYVSLSKLDKKEIDINNKTDELFTSKELLNKAYNHQLKAINILEGIEEIFYLPNAYNGMGTVLGNKKLYTQATKYYLKAYEMTKNKNISTSKTSTEGLYYVYKLSKQYDKALLWHEKFLELKDTINSKNNLKELGKKQAELSFIREKELADINHKNELKLINYENAKRELISKNKQKFQRYIIWSIGIGLSIVFALLVIIARRLKISAKQNKIIKKQKKLIEKEKLATEDSINYALNIQRASFPSILEMKRFIPNSFIFFKPKDIVSGDFYWGTEINNKKIVALADCTGHGVPGAFMTLISINILNQIISDGITNPKQILEHLHIKLQKKLNKKNETVSKNSLDIAICSIENNTLVYAGVHIPIYIIRDKILTEYKGQKLQLGSSKKTIFIEQKIDLQKNDTIYISSDGFPDQKGGLKNKKYYYPNLRKKLTNISNLKLEEQHLELEKELEKWKGNNKQIDDICIMGFKI